MSESPRCPKCGVQLPADAPAGLCPKCLVQAGFESQPASQPGPTVLTPPNSGFVPPTVEELAPLFPQLEILELLGKGGMGAVYKARQPGLDRLVAVKILPPEISRDPAFAERFQREARALARLSHPHIVAVYDFGQTMDVGWPPSAVPHDAANADGRGRPSYYIVMEYVDGANLRQTIRTGKLAAAEALAIVPQICEALQFAHDEGIVHRDIKPENILIDKRGRVKIADFGLAKLLGTDASDHSLTATHQVMGTLRYMAPEQMQGSREVDHRADIYSLGVVFYELLTGELPIGRFAPPSKKVQVDVRLDEIVLRALEQDPEQRYQHASEVKTDVETISRSPSAARSDSAKGVAPPAQPELTPFADSVRATPPAEPQVYRSQTYFVVVLSVLALVGLAMWFGQSAWWLLALLVPEAMIAALTRPDELRTLGSRLRLLIVVLAILGLIAFGMWLEQSPWPLLALAIFSVPIVATSVKHEDETTGTGPVSSPPAHAKKTGTGPVSLPQPQVVDATPSQREGAMQTWWLTRSNVTRKVLWVALGGFCAFCILAFLSFKGVSDTDRQTRFQIGFLDPWFVFESNPGYGKRSVSGLFLGWSWLFGIGAYASGWLLFKLKGVSDKSSFQSLAQAVPGSAVSLPIDDVPLIRRQLKGPAIALMLYGLIIIFPAVLCFTNGFDIADGNDATPQAVGFGMMALSFLLLGLAGLVIRGGWHMLAMESYRAALLASFLGQPIGLWGLFVLSRQEVKSAFGAVSRLQPLGRPKMVPVLATFNLFGAILLMLVCAMEEPAEFAKPMPRLWQMWEQVDAVLGFSMAAGMFAASIGLFLWKPWARKVTLGVCIFGLASFVFDAPYLARFLLPDAYAEIQQTMIDEGVAPDLQDFATLATVACLVGGMMVFILTSLIGQLVYFTRPRVVAAFESPSEKHGKFIEWLFTGAGAVVGVLSVFGPLALLLGIAALFNPGDGEKTVSRVPAAVPPLGTITNGIGAEFTVPAGQVAVFEIVTRRDNATVPVPPHCGYVMAAKDARVAGTFRWAPKPTNLARGSVQKWGLEIRTSGGGGGYSEGALVPDELNAIVGGMALGMNDLPSNEEVVFWGTSDAKNLPANGLIGLRVTVVSHGLETAGGSGNGHIDWKKSQSATSTTRRKLTEEVAP